MIRTQVYLDDDLYTQLRIQSQVQNVPAASLVRKYIRIGMIKKNKSKKMTAGQALLRIARTAVKGPEDLSTRHDDYLYGDK